jgi:hypothetical protein
MRESALLILGFTLMLIGSVGVVTVASSYYSAKLYLNQVYVKMEDTLSTAKQTVDDTGVAVTEMATYFKVMAEFMELVPQLGNTSASILPLISSMENLHGDIHLSSERIDSMNALAQDIFQKAMRIFDISFGVLAFLLALFVVMGVSILLIRRGMVRLAFATEKVLKANAANELHENK